MKTDRRKYMRFEGLLDGTFQDKAGKVSGLTMFTEFSRSGLRVSLNRKVDVGKPLSFDIRFPGGFLSIPATGKVVWVSKRAKDWTYDFDAGVAFDRIDRWDRARLLDYAYESWRKSRADAQSVSAVATA